MLSVKLNPLKYLVLFALLVQFCKAVEGIEDTLIFYRNSSNADGLQSISTTTSRPFFQNARLPCSCYQKQCGCCTGIILEAFRQKACMNFTYEPDDFAIGTTMTMNGRILYSNSFSGKNPSPFCVRVPRLSFIKLCVTLSNIYFSNRNVHFCIEMEANWQDFTLLEWSFDCLRMGLSGFAVVRPEEGGGLPSSSVDVEEQTDEDYDDSARNVPLIIDSKGLLQHNFSSQLNTSLSRGKIVKKKSSVRVPVRAIITPDGDIKFTLE